jgi:hypothetical protein
MKQILVLFAFPIIFFSINVYSQNELKVDRDWSWIAPLKTQKAEIEKAFGNSITEDKDNPFQTYSGEFGKITVTYVGEKEYVKMGSCLVKVGTVLGIFISPKNIELTELNYDLSKFKKDDKFSPREIWYLNEKEGILVVTQIIDSQDKRKVEKVVAIEYRPKINTQ